MRRLIPALATLILLAACEAGDRAHPGADNRPAGPELTITAPASGQVVAGNPCLLFDLRHPRPAAEREGDHVRYVLDDGDVEVWDRALDRATTLPAAPLAEGTHVLRAFVARADGTPYPNRGAAAVRTFHVRRPGGAFSMVRVAKGRYPWRRVRDTDPHLILVPSPRVAARPTVLFTVAGGDLGERRLRVQIRVPNRAPTHALRAGLVMLHGLAAGRHEVVIELQEHVGRGDAARWEPVPGPFNRAVRTIEVAGPR